MTKKGALWVATALCAASLLGYFGLRAYPDSITLRLLAMLAMPGILIMGLVTVALTRNIHASFDAFELVLGSVLNFAIYAGLLSTMQRLYKRIHNP